MELVSPHVHRALAYLRLLNDNGTDPLREDLDSYAVSPGPKNAEYGAPFLGASALAFFQQVIRDAEPVVKYLVKMGWATLSQDDRVQLTDLGRIVLFGLGQEGPTEPQLPAVADVMLEPTDPLAWVNLTRVVAAAGEGLLVDAFFKPDFVHWLVDSTTMRRVLISSKHPKAKRDLTLMAVALGTVPNADVLEVRATDSPELHDRCIIGADGDFRLLGSSVNGVGRNLTAIMKPDAEVARLYRDRYESLWKEATVVMPQNPAGGAPTAPPSPGS
ncbi:hypothetical protein ILP97_18255 [Amycolatopsis sp. H6(2020)]|nr:hypothetical protein [Amycolatopsis sp. H6(2020)]